MIYSYMNTIDSTQYLISLEHFQGPLDLLHQLIEKRKLQINTVSLAKITDDYLAYMRRESVGIDDVAHFVHTASILILIKSKSLLPILEYTKDEETDIAVLEDRVRLLDYIRNKAVPALDCFGCRYLMACPPKQAQSVEFNPDASCTIDALYRNAQTVLNDISFLKEPPSKEVHNTVSIEEMIDRVFTAVTERIKVSFNDMVSGGDKREKIVSFLAVLEMMRKGFLAATQEDQFLDITLSKQQQ